ncbi:MAG: VWA domain-containing protein [Alistipes sp.]|nr:VWA domain-containing protein [Candidatus Minthomonas equi]
MGDSSFFFEYPHLLWLELLLVPMLAIYLWRHFRGKEPFMSFSDTLAFLRRGITVKTILMHAPFVLECLAVALMVIAIARPRSSSVNETIDTEGIDIVLALDVSTSMLARDFDPDRIEAAKGIATEFIAQRPADRMGLVVFAGESFTQCPLTTDRPTLINLLKEVECGLIEDGTAIGNGLATAVARLKDSNAESRVVILLTDGVNNRGEITPMMATDIAKTYGVRVYTIGVGAMGDAPYPVMTPFGVQIQKVPVEIDEKLLQDIAEQTGGAYFRATDNTKLLAIYGEINKMEKVKTTVDSFPIYKELFGKFGLAALILFLLDIVLKLFAGRRIV